MSFWTALVVIVAIGGFIALTAIKSSSRAELARIKTRSGETDENLDELLERVVRLEERMTNIETILLEKEKTDKFRDL